MKKVKKLVGLLSVIGLSVLLVACSSQSGSSTTTKKETKMVKTEMGEIEIPVNPQRVLVNWYVGDLLALDITPVGYAGWAQETMTFYDTLKDIPAIEKWEKEELLSYEPDLIITYDKADFDKFAKVAPVLVIPEDEMTPIERVEFLGEALGKEEAAKKAVTNFETSLAQAKDLFAKPEYQDKTFSVFQDWGSDSYGVYFETGSRGGTILYDYLNLKKPAKLEELIESSGEGRGALSYEVAADYFGDYVMWFLQEDKPSEFAETAIWKSIPAVKADHVTSIPGEYTGLFFYSDVLSLTGQLDYFVKNLK